MSLNFFPEQEQLSDEVIIDLYNKNDFAQGWKKNPTPFQNKALWSHKRVGHFEFFPYDDDGMAILMIFQNPREK